MATYQDSRYNIALPSGSGGAIVPIKTLTASSSDDLTFVNGSSDVVLDNTYRTYIFKFINIHPSTKSAFTVNFRDGSSAYDATKTTTFFTCHHGEDDSPTTLQYAAGSDMAQGTGFQNINYEIDTDNDSNVSGEMYLFSPSSTTYVKHFMIESSATSDDGGDQITRAFAAGICNVTAAIDAVQFKMSSGTIDAGTIKLYGIA